MLFNSAVFLLFFPLVTALYFVFPEKIKNPWLLLASWFFYACWNIEHLPLLLITTLTTFFCGLLLERAERVNASVQKQKRLKKLILFSGVFIDLGILFYFKYTGFAAEILTVISSAAGHSLSLPEFDILLPVGISFYTFQAIGYTADVYRNDIKAEKNFIRYALFVSFFPQLVAGPIERSGRLLSQLKEPKKYDHDRMREGFFVMLWGYFLKLTIADRAAVFVDSAYSTYIGSPGAVLLAATVLFAIQIYCDFAAYSTIAVGAAWILGFNLTDNFDAPYLSVSVKDFWKRWHISLTSWFRDYVYIPLGGNKKGKVRKCLNIMTVFLLSGLWHGADITYVIWGGLNGLYRVAGEVSGSLRKKITSRLPIKHSGAVACFIRGVFTFILTDIAWVFFRAPDTETAFAVIGAFFSRFSISSFTDGSFLKCGLSSAELFLLVLCIAILAGVDICKRRGINVPEKASGLPFPVRCILTVCAVSFILLFGIWGSEYNPSNFIYFRF